eukprot:CAMPEP_0205926876 /NCGR_PEP_ID=MMETSP1325-20131115/21396_1 /ASSEMBLY_ACC=CAM_ASM_000708 /TAXON_ID=236786 /ORGANISM="Florenciella sp., Strain RCC1007" /LENGTH=61 /DNA_ID=CAMNT_0053295657 /DNA_START=235 /DNA_END=416 /DNA_ORIENTATION=+
MDMGEVCGKDLLHGLQYPGVDPQLASRLPPQDARRRQFRWDLVTVLAAALVGDRGRLRPSA